MHESLLKQQLSTLSNTHISALKPLADICQRLFLWCVVLSVSFLSACSSHNANAYQYSIAPQALEYPFMRIASLSSFLIKTKTKNSLAITELSDLAWDADEQLLYAISDEGLLYHLKINTQNNRLQMVDIISAMPLRDKQKRALSGNQSDAEGLTLRNSNNGKRGDSELIISFENKPRIAIHDNKGYFIKKVKTTQKLSKRKSYRGNNKALESVALHPKYGIITAPERPLKENPLTQQTLYSSSGKEWHFQATKVNNSSITAIEVIDNDNILILERAYNGLLSPVVISLRQLNLTNCDKHNFCKVETLASFDSSEGWILDNFEGLTHLKDNQYLMVSDNNKNPLQKTILVLFEVLN